MKIRFKTERVAVSEGGALLRGDFNGYELEAVPARTVKANAKHQLVLTRLAIRKLEAHVKLLEQAARVPSNHARDRRLKSWTGVLFK